ncbi:MAG TPA: hypothetical protein VF905_09615 [Nitrospirota bacterium]
MLSGLYTYLTTTCPQYVRHMAYLDEAIAMRGRYRRNGEAWRPHLEKTRRFILSVAEKCRNRNKAVVLGAGLLLDVPLDDLSSLFQEVVLVDIVFLPEVRSSIKQFGNVKLLQHDVTNMAKQLHENIRRGHRELPEAAPEAPEIDEKTGLVVSLNLLSQLWVVPRSYAIMNLSGLNEEQVDDWCRRTVESHYAFLRSMPCDVCLVADHEFVKRDQEGCIVSRGSTVSGLVLPEPDASWTWNIVPMGESRQYLSKELYVGAWHLQ